MEGGVSGKGGGKGAYKARVSGQAWAARDRRARGDAREVAGGREGGRAR